MSLTTRMVVFCQATLALVLAVFCVTLYVAAHWYVGFQAEASVERAVDTLVASVDIEEDSVEWEPSDRALSLGTGPLGATLYWYITDANHHLVDRSGVQGTTDLMTAAETGIDAPPALSGWIVARKLVHPPGASGALLTRARTEEEIQKGEYPALVFTTGLRTDPHFAVLNTLAIGLGSVSSAIWIAALLAARWICRQALKPVTDMADAARAMCADDVSARLPPANARGELEELHVAFSGLLDRLHAALGRERQFTAEASHQLRTPLGTILGQVEVALRQPRSQEEYQRVLGVVRRQAMELTRSVEALLFLARSDADAPPPAMEQIELAEWLRQFLGTYQAYPRRKDISFETPANVAMPIAAHAPLLKEMLANLLDNALKYSAEGSPVVIRLQQEGNQIRLIVEDRGIGIAAADMPHVFGPFFRSQCAVDAQVPGTGLGLTVVARIAGAFRGRVEIEKPAGGIGTRIVVHLPRVEHKEDFISASSVP